MSLNKFRYLHKKLNGSTLEYDLSPYEDTVHQIYKYHKTILQYSDLELKYLIEEIKIKLKNDTNPLNFIVNIYAIAYEVILRTHKIVLYKKQLIGAVAMANLKAIEMKTGEGKTITAVLPAILYGLTSKGVHVLTFNDYLATRDTNWMKPIYNFFNLEVNHIQQGMTHSGRKFAYSSDITYLTAKEAGFDFLKDSLVFDLNEKVHQQFHFTIIDEADSILIDEARIPLVIAGDTNSSNNDLYKISSLIKTFKKNKDYQFDKYMRNVFLTEMGINKIEEHFNFENLFESQNNYLLAQIQNALHAHTLLYKNIDYIIRDNKIEQVDEFTGRIAHKRKWPDELQAAVEAKENLKVQKSAKILNSISLQYFINQYPLKCAMSATLKSSEEELKSFYNFDTVIIPPHKKCIRQDEKDFIYRTIKEKHHAIIKEVVKVHKTKRPILIGTQSVDESNKLAALLKKHNIFPEVLNAKNDFQEASIIAKAGNPGAITISTNMAGRGVDIKLGGEKEIKKKQVMNLGGLYVIGTNRYESTRIDNQLRGRAGRQGEPGLTRFFISMEDTLFLKFHLDELIPPKIFNSLPNGKITNSVIRSEILRIQRIIEGQNFEIKQTLGNYTFLIEKQRQIIFNLRENILKNKKIKNSIISNIKDKYNKFQKIITQKELNDFLSTLYIFQIDQHWRNYLYEMNSLRDTIHLRRIGGENPLFEFRKLSINQFEILIQNIEFDVIKKFNSIPVCKKKLLKISNSIKRPSATWTYLINDKEIENCIGIEMLNNIGLSFGLLITWPLMIILNLYKRIFKPYFLKEEHKYN